MKRDYAGLGLAMAFPSIMAWLYFVAAAGDEQGRNVALMLAFGAGKFVQFTFPAFYAWWFEPERLRPTAPTRRGLRRALAFGVGVGLAMLVAYFAWLKHTSALADPPAKVYQKVQEFGLATPAGFVLLAAFISVAHALLEEYYWRWFVFGWLRKYLSLWPAIVLSSLAFMGHHVIILGVYFPGSFWTLAMPFSLCVALGGGVWAWIYESSRSIWAAWLSHLLIDAAIMVVGYDMISQFWV